MNVKSIKVDIRNYRIYSHCYLIIFGRGHATSFLSWQLEVLGFRNLTKVNNNVLP